MRWLLVALVFFLAGCDTQDRLNVNDPEIELVREWIAEHSDSGKWDEVEWEEPVRAANGDATLRMKYRTESKEGGAELFDHTFWIKNGRIETVERDQERLWRKLKGG